MGHRFDRSARHEAELGHDAGVRHAADDRVRLSLFGIPAEGGQGARRADRYLRWHAEPALPDGGQPARRQQVGAVRTSAPAATQDRPHLAPEGGEECHRLVEGSGEPCDALGGSAQSAARVLGTVAATAGGRDHQQRLRIGRQLVRTRCEGAAWHDVLAVRWPRQYGRRRALRDRRQVRASRTGLSSRWSATVRCR